MLGRGVHIVTCISPRPGEDVVALARRLEADGEIPTETADTIEEFAAFLQTTKRLGLAAGESLPPNVMRRFRVLLNMSHAEIDAAERQLFEQEVARPHGTGRTW
jgi:hypothetical protein